MKNLIFKIIRNWVLKNTQMELVDKSKLIKLQTTVKNPNNLNFEGVEKEEAIRKLVSDVILNIDEQTYVTKSGVHQRLTLVIYKKC